MTDKPALLQNCSKKFFISSESACLMDEHGENSCTLRHMHIPNTALHFQAYASMQQGIPAFSHRDKPQCRYRKKYITPVNAAVTEFSVI